MANGEEPPATVSAQLPPATQGGAVSTVGQGVVSTSTPTNVTASTAGVQVSTNTKASGITASILSVNQDAFSGLLQVAALQQKLASLSVGGGVIVPLPPVNVIQVPFFKTITDSTMFEMNNLLKFLPPTSITPGSIANMDGIFGILRQIAGEHRVLMVNNRGRDIEAKLKDVSNPMNRHSIEHDLRLLKCVTNIKKCLTIGGSIWKFMSGLEDLDKECGHIDMVTLRSQEKAFAVGGTSKWSGSDFMVESSKSSGKRKIFTKNYTAKEHKKAKGEKGKEHGVKGGKVGQSPKNGCHHCKGALYVSECLKSPESMTVD